MGYTSPSARSSPAAAAGRAAPRQPAGNSGSASAAECIRDGENRAQPARARTPAHRAGRGAVIEAAAGAAARPAAVRRGQGAEQGGRAWHEGSSDSTRARSSACRARQTLNGSNARACERYAPRPAPRAPRPAPRAPRPAPRARLGAPLRPGRRAPHGRASRAPGQDPLLGAALRRLQKERRRRRRVGVARRRLHRAVVECLHARSQVHHTPPARRSRAARRTSASLGAPAAALSRASARSEWTHDGSAAIARVNSSPAAPASPRPSATTPRWCSAETHAGSLRVRPTLSGCAYV